MAVAVPAAIAVRRALLGDASRLAAFSQALAQESEGRRVDMASVRASIAAALADEDKARYYVAEAQGDVIGSLFVTREWSDWTNGWYWWIQGVYVTPPWRRKGVWRALLAAVEEDARRSGVRRLRLYVHGENERARRGYDATGFAAEPYVIYDRAVEGAAHDGPRNRQPRGQTDQQPDAA